MIYLLTAIGLSPGGSNTHLHIHNSQNDTKQTIHRTTQQLEECGPCPVLASYTLPFALQPRKKHGKTSVRVAASKFTFLADEPLLGGEVGGGQFLCSLLMPLHVLHN